MSLTVAQFEYIADRLPPDFAAKLDDRVLSFTKKEGDKIHCVEVDVQVFDEDKWEFVVSAAIDMCHELDAKGRG